MFKDTPLVIASLMRLLSLDLFVPSTKEPTSTLFLRAEVPRGRWRGRPVPRALLTCSWAPAALVTSAPHLRAQTLRKNSFFKQKPAVSHLDDTGGENWAAYRNITQRIPFSNNFHTLSAPKETVQEQKLGRRQTEKLKCGNSICWFWTICLITRSKMDMAIVSGQYFPKEVTELMLDRARDSTQLWRV